MVTFRHTSVSGFAVVEVGLPIFKRFSLRLTLACMWQGSFARWCFAQGALPGVITRMGPRDSRSGPMRRLWIPAARCVPPFYHRMTHRDRASQVPGTTFDARCPRSPRTARRLQMPVALPSAQGFTTPESLTTAKCLTRPKRVHAFALRLASSPTLGLGRSGHPSQRPGSYMSNRQFTWQTPSSLQVVPSFAWRTRSKRRKQRLLCYTSP